MASTEPETNLVTYLELRQPPRATKPWPGAAFRIVRLERPSVRFYRYLYATVGEGWFWELRKRFDDAELAAIVHDPRVELYLLTEAGTPAGYGEIDRRVANEAEIAYFGLVPEAVGRGLGVGGKAAARQFGGLSFSGGTGTGRHRYGISARAAIQVLNNLFEVEVESRAATGPAVVRRQDYPNTATRAVFPSPGSRWIFRPKNCSMTSALVSVWLVRGPVRKAPAPARAMGRSNWSARLRQTGTPEAR